LGSSRVAVSAPLSPPPKKPPSVAYSGSTFLATVSAARSTSLATCSTLFSILAITPLGDCPVRKTCGLRIALALCNRLRQRSEQVLAPFRLRKVLLQDKQMLFFWRAILV